MGTSLSDARQLHCSSRFRRGASFTAGQLISNGATDLEVCSNECYPILRKVVSSSTATNYEGSTCPTGKTCVVVSTESVLVSDLVTKQFANKAEFASFINQPFDLEEKCKAINELPEVSRIFDSLDLPHSERRIKFKGKCPDVWLERTGEEGQCTNSQCSGSQPCFFCKNECDNGCGSGWLNPLIPEKTFLWNFGPACCHHDHCYVSTASQEECDLRFLGSLLEACESSIGPRGCRNDAYVYYKFVDWFGEDPKMEAQKKQADHEIDNCQTDFILSVRPDSGSYDIFVRNKAGNGMTVTVLGTDSFTASFSDTDKDGVIDTPRIPKGQPGVQDLVTATDLTTNAVKTFTFTFA